MAPSSSVLALLQAYVDGMNTRDTDAIAATLAPDAERKVYPEHLGARHSTSRDEIVAMHKGANAIIPEGKLKIAASCVEDLKVWARVEGSGTFSTGEKFDSIYVYMVETAQDANGELKITRIEELVDAVLGQKMIKLKRGE